MTRLVLLAIVLFTGVLGGCGYTPQQLGITGPGTSQTTIVSHASEADDDAVIPMPGLPTGYVGRDDNPRTFAPSYGQNGRFYNYN